MDIFLPDSFFTVNLLSHVGQILRTPKRIFLTFVKAMIYENLRTTKQVKLILINRNYFLHFEKWNESHDSFNQ